MTDYAPIEQILQRRRLETLVVQDTADSVFDADERAWSCLEQVLGGDPIAAWHLKGLSHTYIPAHRSDTERPAVAFQAEFVRIPADDPDEEVIL